MLSLLLGFSAGLADQPSTCTHLTTSELKAVATKVEKAGSQSELYRELGFLMAYWNRVCLDDRMHATAEQVRSVSGLLKIRNARFAASTVLFDVRDNLRAAKSDVRSAMKDQRVMDAKYEREHPLPGTTGKMMYKSLSCINRLILKGTVDNCLCRDIVAARVKSGD